MSKKINIEKNILKKIKSEEIKMKPKWYFVLGSSLMFPSLVGISVLIIFLINLIIFLIRRNGHNFPYGRIGIILNAFPWWIPFLAIAGIILATWLLKKYDFSYKNNFKLVVLAFVLATILAGVLIENLGINESLKRGRMRRFYQQFEKVEEVSFRGGQVWGWRNYDRIRR